MEGILRKPDVAEIETHFAQSYDLASGLVYFPVRHHSPGCAFHLLRTIEQYRPDEILIEGPVDSGELLPYIADSGSEPPFCIYYSYDDKEGKVSEEKEKYRAYYPFLAFSPELVAIRQGAASGIPVRLIDLPYAWRLVNKVDDGEKEIQFYYNENKEYEVNAFTAGVAARAGCRSFSEFWESRYEIDSEKQDTRAFVRNIFYLGYYMRQTTPVTEASYKEDCQREMYMADEIRKSLAEGKRVLVVAGAFHIAGLQEALHSGATSQLKVKCNPDHVASYLMPYTFREADSKSGYAAGMPFPAFYDHIWQKMTAGKKDIYDSTVLDYIIKTARYARKSQSISLPDEINALTMTRSLARLRGKPSPGVYELLDGVKSCFVKGDINATSTFEIDFLLGLMSGMGAGSVVANQFVPPVVNEFRALCAQHRLKTSTIQRQEITLDIIKNPAHFSKSRFLHQLQFLETDFCTLQSGPDYVNRKDRNLMREIWVCRYSTHVETRLIDLSVYGTTLSQICSALIERQFKDNLTAEDMGKLLLSVQVMGIDNFYAQYQESIRQVINNEKNFINLVKLTGNLLYLATIQQLMEGRVDPLVTDLTRNAFKEATLQITTIKNVNEDEEQSACEHLRNLYSYTLDPGNRFDTELFITEVDRVTQDSFSNSRLFGTCLAIRYKNGDIAQETFCDHITAYLESSIGRPEEAASFVCGLFLIARDVLFIDPRILQALDAIIAKVDDEVFLTVLPNLRYAFTDFLPAELNRLGGIIAEQHHVAEIKLSGSNVVSHEEIVKAMQLDALAAEALNLWKL